MVYFVSETFRFGFGGLVRPKSSLPSSKTDQNELRRLNQASIDGLRCLGVPSDPPNDISCTWIRSELFGMENLAVTRLVTNVWQAACHTLVTHLSHPDSPSPKVPIESRCKKYRWVGPIGHAETSKLSLGDQPTPPAHPGGFRRILMVGDENAVDSVPM